MRTIAVFCGSSEGSRRSYREAAAQLGERLATLGLELVYGGGRVGLMGVLADAALAAGGRVTGVMPRSLVDRELAHLRLSSLEIVETMHVRKTRMAELSEAFIALPGGAGTLEEMFEQWTWAQLGIHAKPCGFLNIHGYFDPLRIMIDKMVTEGFLALHHAEMVAFEPDADTLLDYFRRYAPPSEKWAQPTKKQSG